MKSALILFTGILLASAELSAASSREEYFRAKYGRNSPAQEARLRAVTQRLAAHGRMPVEAPAQRFDAPAGAACQHACCR